MTLDPVIAWSVRLALALLFTAAAWHKLPDARRFEGAVRAYRLVPSEWTAALAWLLPFAEGAIALGLIYPSTYPAAAVAAGVVLSIYTLAISVNLVRGRREIDCGCFASAVTVPLSAGLVARNLGLIAASCMLLVPIRARTLVWMDAVTIVMGLATLSLLWAAGRRLTQTGPALRRLGGVR